MRNELVNKILVCMIIGLFFGTSIMPFITNNVRAETMDELVAYWNFNENNGDTIYDISSNGNNGIINGDAQRVNGLSGNALYYDGINDYVDFGSPSSLIIPGNLTVSAWVKTTLKNNDQFIIFKGYGWEGTISWYLAVLANTGKVIWCRYYGASNTNTRYQISNVNITDGEWHYVCGVDDGTMLRIFIDGVEEGAKSISGLTPFTESNSLIIGKLGQRNLEYFNGNIDEVRIYNRALNESEITYLYNNPGSNENQPPIANFSWTPHYPNQNQTTTFNASSSYDPDGILTLFEWDWNNDGIYDESSTNPIVTHTWSQGGDYPVSLRVTDNANSLDTISKTVNVSKSNQPPTSGLVGYWNFNEGGGNIAYDSSSEGHNGMIYGSPQWVSGKSGSALYFDGVDDYVNVGPYTQFGGNQSFSLCAWVRKTTSQIGGEPNILNNMYSSASGINLFCNSNRQAVMIGGINGSNNQAPVFHFKEINDSQWHLLVGTYDGINLSLFYDGNFSGSRNNFSSYTPSNMNMNIGRMEQGDRFYFEGDIDEVCIYNRALSYSEIKYLYNNTNGGNQAPIAYFTWTPTNPTQNQQITFNASVSYDPDGTITLYEWDWNNDGIYDESKTSPGATHSWSQKGNYSVTLRVTDNSDSKDIITKTVNVNEPIQPPTSGLVGYWSFNEGSGVIAHDSSGNENDGTIYGASRITGISGNALNFDGVNDYIDLVDSASVRGLSFFTIATWVKTTGISDTPRYIYQEDSFNEQGAWARVQFYIEGNSENIVLDIRPHDGDDYGRISLSSSNSLTPGTWHHIVGIWATDGTTETEIIYIDGSINSQTSIQASIQAISDSPPFNGVNYIGGCRLQPNSPRGAFYGIIDEVRIYNRTLNDSAIEHLYNNPNGGSQPPIANFTWTPTNPDLNQQITFNASTSYDDGTITLYEWDWNNDGIYEESNTSSTATHSWSQAGNYSVTLRATDNNGSNDTITKTVNVSEQIHLLTITTNEVTNIGTTTATLNGVLTDDGGKGCQVGFQYGLTTSYGNAIYIETTWKNRTDCNGWQTLRGSSYARHAYRYSSFSGVIKSVQWYIEKAGSPTGNIYSRIRYVSNDTIIAEASIDVSTLTTSFAWYTFSFTGKALSSTDIYITIEYPAGNDNNFVWVGFAYLPGFPYSDNGDYPYSYYEQYNVWFADNAFWCIKINCPSNNITSVYNLTNGISGLTEGTVYHFRAKATNTVGTGYGSDKAFLTKPYPLTSFTAITNNFTKIDLNWINHDGGDGAYIEYVVNSSPIFWNPGDGIKINDTGYVQGSSFQHTGLMAGTYYYKAWAYAKDSDVTSDGSATKPFGDSPMTDYAYAIGRLNVMTNNATNVEVKSATLNGNLTDVVGENYIVGFEYGTNTSYGYTAITSNSWDNYTEGGGSGIYLGGDFHRIAEKYTSFTGVPVSVQLYLSPYYSPSGNIYTRVRYVSNDTIICSSNPVEACSVNGWTIFYYTTISFLKNEDIYVSLEYSGPELVGIRGGPKDFRSSWYHYNVGPWYEYMPVAIDIEFAFTTGNGIGNFSGSVSGLTTGALYHFRAMATNLKSTVYGSDKTFLTKPYPLTSFTAITNNFTKIDLNWINHDGGDGAYIEYVVNSSPIFWNPGDGIKINDTGYVQGSSFQHTGLVVGTYYYKAWAYSEDSGVKSDGSATKPFGDNPLTDNASTEGPGNQPPIANFTWEPQVPGPGEVISFNASNSYDPDGFIVNWTWDFGDGYYAFTNNVTHIYPMNESYNVNLTIRDNLGAIDYIKQIIHVGNKPVAVIDEIYPSIATQDELISFVGHGGAGIIDDYLWSSDIDGEFGYNPSVCYSGFSLGIHNISFMVKNSYGVWSDPVFSSVRILPIGSLADLAINSLLITFSNYSPLIGDNITINATVNNIGSKEAYNISVSFFDNYYNGDILIQTLIGNTTIGYIPSQPASRTTSIIWNITPNIPFDQFVGYHIIRVIVDPNDTIPETYERNNIADLPLVIRAEEGQLPAITEMSLSGLESGFNKSKGEGFNVFGNALYQYPNWTLPACGANVVITINETGEQWTTWTSGSKIHGGEYSCVISAPKYPGNYHVTVKATDFTLTAYYYFNFTVIRGKPDLLIGFLRFNNQEPTTCDTVQISAEVFNRQDCNVKVCFYDIYQGIVVPLTCLVKDIHEDTSQIYTINWKPSGPGWHTIKAVIDPDNNISESNEFNNWIYEKIYVWDCCVDFTPVELYFSEYTPYCARENDCDSRQGQTIFVTALIKNIGGISSGTNVTFTIPGDTYSVYVDNIPGKGGYRYVTAPLKINNCGYNTISVLVNLDQHVPECNINNNNKSRGLIAHLPLADIYLKKSDLLFSGYSGLGPIAGVEHVIIAQKVYNNNFEHFDPTTGNYYEHLAEFCACDVLVRFTEYDSLEGWENITDSIIPGALCPGNSQVVTALWNTTCEAKVTGWHTIKVYADPEDRELEVMENNNFVTKDIYIYPNCSDPTPKDFTLSGCTPTITATIQNIGGLPINNVLVKIWDNTTNELLWTSRVNISGKHGSIQISFEHNFTIPGLHQILIKVDPYNTTDEIDHNCGYSGEKNNNYTYSFNIRPDLIVDDFTYDCMSDPIQGDPIHLNAVVKNSGFYPITQNQSFQVKFYADNSYIGNDTISGGLNTCETKIAAIIWNTSSVTPKTYTIKATIDPAYENHSNGDIIELNENNNDGTIPINIWSNLPDFKPINIYFSEETPYCYRETNYTYGPLNGTLRYKQPGQQFVITSEIINIGGSGSWTNVTFIDLFDGREVNWSTVSIYVPGKNGKSIATTTFRLKEEGSHTIKVAVDKNRTIPENNENNNNITKDIWAHKPLSDLYLKYYYRLNEGAPLEYIPEIEFNNTNPIEGEYVNISEKVYNNNFEHKNYLSNGYTDDLAEYPAFGSIVQFTEYDAVEGWENIGTTTITTQGHVDAQGRPDPGRFDPGDTAIVYIPWDTTGEGCHGIHTIKAYADPYNEVVEVREDNNIAQKTINVWANKPDLIPTDLWLTDNFPPAEIFTNVSTDIHATIRNHGGINAEHFNVSFYDNGIFIGKITDVTCMGMDRIINLTLENYLIDYAGPHIFRVYVDSDKNIDEKNESNNILDKNIFVHQPEPDLHILSEDITFWVNNSETTSAHIGEYVTIKVNVHNWGLVDTYNSSIVFYVDLLERISPVMTIPYIPTQGYTVVETAWEVPMELIPGYHAIYVLVEPNIYSYDPNPDDNMASRAIQIQALNHSPVAYNDTTIVSEDSSNNVIDVRANDFDVDGDTLSIVSVAQPSHGNVSTDEVYCYYTPNPHWHGNDSFTYTISDGHGGIDTANVSINVLAKQYILTITIQGQGNVSKYPDQASYTYGILVNISANSAVGWSFDHWSGDASGTASATSVTINGNKSVTANFSQDHYTLTITVQGSGNVTVNPNQTSYTYGQVVTLTANPAAGWSFNHWSGNLTGNNNPTTIFMNENKKVFANFTQTYAIWTNSSQGDDTINWPGSSTQVKGNIHTNSGIKISGTNNHINGTIEYTTTNNIRSGNTYNTLKKISPRPMPVYYDISAYKPGGTEAVKAQAQGKYHYIQGDLTISNSNVVLNGLYYVTGKVSFSGSKISGTVTIVSNGKVAISGSQSNFSAYSNSLLFFCNGTEFTISGSQGSFTGIIYSPSGTISISGSKNTIMGSLFGNKFVMTGSETKITAG